MYTHILIPSDGSALAERGVQAGIELARLMHARVTAFTAVPEYRLPTYSECVSRTAISRDEHERLSRGKAAAVLERIAARARAAGLECDTDFAQNDHPYEAIVEAAREHDCDLICMASHGRRGISALVHGSETQGVLTHSTIPMVVYR